jgi:hypothetical protein
MPGSNAMPHLLSKSTYLYGCQCPKRLALHKLRPDLKNPPDPSQEALFTRGINVGHLARELFPGGVDAAPPNAYSYSVSVKKTAKLMAEGATVIYEAAFQHDGLLCALDILMKDDAGWQAYEVKSSTEVKDTHLEDAAYQYYVMRSAGLDVGSFHIIHINNTYVRNGPLDLRQLFTMVPVLDEVRSRMDFVHTKAEALKALVKSRQVPEAEIGPHCFEPYECDFTNYCWQHVPDGSVFDLAGNLRGKDWELYNKGVVRLLDIPADYDLPTDAALQLQHYRSGEPRIDRDAIRRFLDSLQYPLRFLDFETFIAAVPEFDGTRPYQQLPFQYSLHVSDDGIGITHHEFLADPHSDPRRHFAEALLDHLGGRGTIVAYNAAFEKSVLKKLVEQLPNFADDIQPLLEDFADLMQPFRSRNYYHPEFKGSYSIKEVLPVLVPDLNYATLNIRNGGMAGEAYALLRDTTDPAEAAQLRSDLLAYCKMDTWAMVRILGKLRELVA